MSLYNSTFNPYLNCIEVDDTSYSKNNWTNVDPWSTFSNNCILIGGNGSYNWFHWIIECLPKLRQLVIDKKMEDVISEVDGLFESAIK